ncbi:MAG TPA: bifunctional diaminohydroxyphosphoribosylaminopyrimidine deaminase/5-amino-6-(5-phosphoribosylamino)uracil reductase RibD [Phycisphaerales bacterium]|nr:bifunctional diaminohydroxyphosphoribosylaminopyrimidine deaminase/5-amino-6-(5-phosphoribosylamino)uracil reductase RibD [Phycisphaerales bacterium]
MPSSDVTTKMLDLATRAAWRGGGRVEPNPMVGCVIAKGSDIIGIGHHQRYGSLHAEREALANVHRRGHDPRGATAYVTLEPCCHHGKQPPCTEALIEAGIKKVVFARHDPAPASCGGSRVLRDAGIEAELCESSSAAVHLSDPFVKRITTGMPWVIAKWAQTVDGRIATRTGQSQWISSDLSRRRVHHLRERVDAIITGLGTALHDDPRLTVRLDRRPRRIPRRVVIDTDLDLPTTSKLVRTAREIPVTACCSGELKSGSYLEPRRAALEAAGVEIMGVRSDNRRLDLDVMLKQLVDAYDTTNVLIECGPGLLGSFFEFDLIDEAVVYIAPLLLGDELAKAAAVGRTVPSLSGGRNFRLMRIKRVGDDVELVYRRPVEHAARRADHGSTQRSGC